MGQRIPKDDAKRMCENWTGSKQPGNSKSPGKAIRSAGFEDTYETWFSVDELEKYLKYVKDKIKDNPGIRIYFGNYGKNIGPANNSCTVFLAPTRGASEERVDAIENVNDYDTDPYNSGTGRIPPAPYDPNA
ncbi:hypothetical protein [Christiangramia echinicola]|uniref:hypothetical protein n=1 Tax=Christiangramia echinicola TaxID=279359 RepID=UPI00040E8A69|nr:hypothetical protein [Christiangramia echinicola]